MASKPHKSSVLFRIVSFLGTAGAILLGVVGFAALASLRPEPKQLPPTEKHFNVDVFVVRENCLRETLSGFGTVLPDREVTLSAQVAGEVVDQNLEVGYFVTADKPLLEIDPRIYQQRHAQAKRQLEEGESELRRLKQEQANAARLLKTIKSNLEIAAEQHNRRKRLEGRDIVTPDEMSRSLLELRQYEENQIRQENEIALYPLKIDQVEKRQATNQTALEMAQLDLDHTKVQPPFSGVVSEVFVETGDYVRMGDPLVRITNNSSVEIPVPLKLTDYAKLLPLLKKGQSPEVKLATDVTRPAEWTGRLTRTAPKADQNNRTIEVYVEVENDKQTTPLLPGTFVHARIEGPVLERVFAIPRDAIINDHVLLARPDEDSPVVQQPIEPSDTLQNLAILKTGLKDGDRLILTNLDVLYRDPAEIHSQSQGEKRTLTINQTHDLNAFLKEEDQVFIKIQDCQ